MRSRCRRGFRSSAGSARPRRGPTSSRASENQAPINCALRYGDGWIPHLRRPQYEDVTDFLPQFKEMAAAAGRDPAQVPITVWGAPEDLDRLRRYRDQGVARGVVQLAAEQADAPVGFLARWAGLIGKLPG